MSAKRINSVKQGVWKSPALSRYLRLGQFRILGFRETAWFYVVGLTTAILIFWQPSSNASAISSPMGSDQEAVGIQALGNKEIEFKTASWDPFLPQDAPKIVILALNTEDVPQSVTNRITMRIRQNSPRKVSGLRSALIHTITSATTAETASIPTPPDQPHAMTLKP